MCVHQCWLSNRIALILMDYVETPRNLHICDLGNWYTVLVHGIFAGAYVSALFYVSGFSAAWLSLPFFSLFFSACFSSLRLTNSVHEAVLNIIKTALFSPLGFVATWVFSGSYRYQFQMQVNHSVGCWRLSQTWPCRDHCILIRLVWVSLIVYCELHVAHTLTSRRSPTTAIVPITGHQNT